MFIGELAPEVPQVELVATTRIAMPEDKRQLKPVELSDLDRLDSIPLSDFNLDFSSVVVPTEEMDEDALDAFADTVYRQMIAT